MQYFNDCTGRRVIVKDVGSQEQLVDTTIIEFDKLKMSIVIQSPSLRVITCERVSVLIFVESGLFEFKGTIRKTSVSDAREITLYKGQEKQERPARFEINAPGRVENLVIAKRLFPLPQPLDVTVCNISTSGALIRTTGSLFNIGTTFQLQLDIGENQTRLSVTVVRITPIGEEYVDYGCKLNQLYS